MLSKKPSIFTITASEMRALNRSSVLEWIRCNGPISRSQIAEELQVSLPTVMRIIDELTDQGLVKELGIRERSRGRKRRLLKFNGSEHAIIGIDLGGTKIYGAVADLDGRILYEMNFDHHQNQAEECLQVVFQIIDALLKITDHKGLLLRGIGIGVPGVVSPETGMVSFAPAMSWYEFPLKNRLEDRYSSPIVIGNDVNLAALGEAWFGLDDPGERNLVLLAIGTGIGAGVVIDGSVYSGIHHMAGEIGYLLLDRNQLGKSYPGFGAFEQLASGSGIQERARKMFKEKFPAEPLEKLSAEDVFSAARRHESWMESILQETIDYLAQAIAAIALCYDPDIVLLGGGVSRSADLLIEPILHRLDGAIPIVPKLQVSRLGYRATVMGVVIQLLRLTSDYYTIRKLKE
jgi:glucokinase